MPKRIAFLSLFGTIIEWMDFTLYGYFANIIALNFFPHSETHQRLLWAFGIFASGLLLRPLGAIFFGHIADRHGRKKTIVFTIIMSGVATLGIGFLPSFAQWGVLATTCLILLRICQSIALAGENGIIIFLLEHTKKSPNFYGSLIGTASSFGMFLSALLVMLFTANNLPDWAWRIPYLIGGLLCITVGLLRLSVAESPEFAKAALYRKIRKRPFLTALKKYPGSIGATMAFAAFMGLYTYVCNIYFHTYLINFAGFSIHAVAVATIFGQFTAICMIPLAGAICDYTQKNSVLVAGLITATIIPPVMFMLADTHSINNMIFAMFLYGVGMGLSLAPMFKTLFDLFPTELRYSGYTGAWNISIAIFGGTAPLISQWLANHQLADFAGIYVSVGAFVALFIIIRIVLTEHLDRKRFRFSI